MRTAAGKAALMVLAAAIAPLVVALVSQYGFGMYPCHLCVLQRIPYGVIAALAVLAFVVRMKARPFKLLFVVMALAALVDAGIAGYHVAVEHHWVSGPGGCTADTSGGEQSLEQLRAQIMGTPIAMCDNPTAVWLGVSMAGWNMAYAVALSVALVLVLRRGLKGHRHEH